MQVAHQKRSIPTSVESALSIAMQTNMTLLKLGFAPRFGEHRRAISSALARNGELQRRDLIRGSAFQVAVEACEWEKAEELVATDEERGVLLAAQRPAPALPPPGEPQPAEAKPAISWWGEGGVVGWLWSLIHKETPQPQPEEEELSNEDGGVSEAAGVTVPHRDDPTHSNVPAALKGDTTGDGVPVPKSRCSRCS